MNIEVLDVSQSSYAERVTAAALQGLVNRRAPILFLNYGIYDDPLARRTNEIFIDDNIWFGKFRAQMGNQDKHNLEYYLNEHHASATKLANLTTAVEKHLDLLHGCVIWDEVMPDTINLALMISAQENLLPVAPSFLELMQHLGLNVVHDLRSKWKDRVPLYRWAFEEFYKSCESGRIACIEPDWQRPEFLDYLVQHKIFIYNLSSLEKGPGNTLLMLLAFGPAWLREILFALHLDVSLRRLGLRWMAARSPEVQLNSQIQQAVRSATYPTIFGWHTHRDDELSFMLLLSSNGLRLIPSHLADNFSFHSQVTPIGFAQPAGIPPLPPLDLQGTYLTFTLSDGDQLMMMSTAEMGNWYSTRRGQVAFNWEIQPLLCEIAPALLEKFQHSATSQDCLIAGPSGAGYIVPPLAPDLPAYLQETGRVCEKVGVKVATTYVPDPPRRVLRQLAKNNPAKLNYLAGYAVVKRAPQHLIEGTMIIANQIPRVNQLWDSADALLKSVRQLAEIDAPTPRFIAVHLFAYRTTYEDVVEFVSSIHQDHIHIVRGDVFLDLARNYFQSLSRKG